MPTLSLLPQQFGRAPLWVSSEWGYTDMVLMFLATPGIEVNKADVRPLNAPLTLSITLHRLCVNHYLLNMHPTH